MVHTESPTKLLICLDFEEGLWKTQGAQTPDCTYLVHQNRCLVFPDEGGTCCP
jgi:hypothetical protein